MSTVTVTARVRDAAGHETTKQAALTVDRGQPRDRLSARPNDGSGLWPDFSNTGHTKAPGYPGKVTDYKSGMTASGWLPLDMPAGSTTSFKRFLGKVGVSYTNRAGDITFVGCLFEGTEPNDNLIQIYAGGRVTFKYCTFRPAGLTAPPGNDGTASSARSAPGTPYSKSWQYISTMVEGSVVTFDHCDIWGNAGLQCVGGRSPDVQSIFKDSYIHDQADNDGSGGSGYHHDGIGPNSEGGANDIVIDNCTIASRGNTNGIALQGSSTYNRVKITGCYLSGWGYAVCVGASSPWQGRDIAVVDNVFSAELPSLFGPWYGVGKQWNSGGNTNMWRGNRYQVRVNDANTLIPLAANGKYWWPSDNTAHAGDYTG